MIDTDKPYMPSHTHWLRAHAAVHGHDWPESAWSLLERFASQLDAAEAERDYLRKVNKAMLESFVQIASLTPPAPVFVSMDATKRTVT